MATENCKGKEINIHAQGNYVAYVLGLDKVEMFLLTLHHLGIDNEWRIPLDVYRNPPKFHKPR